MKKSILLLFAAFATLVASAQTKVEIDGIWYNLDESTKQAEVTNGNTKYSGAIAIPATVTHEGAQYSVTSIREYAFSYCVSLIAITIPEGVTSIGNYAFNRCSSLTTITIPEGVTSIGSSAFENCSRLTDITIPESVTSIGSSAFENCSSLNPITIPESVTSIGYDAFYNCSSLTTITIPVGVTSIGGSAFCGCTALKKVIFEDCSKTLLLDCISGSGLFYDCPLEFVYIGRNLSYNCDYSPFYESGRYPTISFGDSITAISPSLFYGNSSLTTITIPEGVTSIGSSAFENCSSLTTINIPEGVTSIGSYAFYRCSNLTAINIPEGVTSIGDNAFASCTSLTTINIPEGVTSIESSAFYNCSSLIAITIPESVTSIRSSAFNGCSSLLDIYCYAENKPLTNSNAFNNSNISNATLHVPANAINNYKSIAPWSSFGTIKVIENVTLEKCATPTIGYADGKVVFACDTEGAIVKSSTTVNGGGDRNVLKFDLIPTYTIIAYATKAKYEDSDIATLTLCWIPCTEEHESEEDGILTIPSKPVLISTQGGTITVSGLAAGTAVAAYSTAGTQLATATATDGTATLATNLEAGSIAIVKVGDYSIKVAIK